MAVQTLIPIVSITVSASATPTLGGVTTLTARVSGPTGTPSAVNSSTSYSCAPGTGHVVGSNCVIDPVTTAATDTVSCPVGTISGSDCVDGTSNILGPVTHTYSCDPGTGTLSGTSCTTSGSSTAATPTTTYTCVNSSDRLAGSLCFSGDVLPAGTMNWTVTNPQGISIPCTTTGATEDDSGLASPTTAFSCLMATSTAGTYHAVANYPGDINYNSANSFPITVVVPHVAPTITVTGAALSNVFRAPITFTAVVAGVTGSSAPTGSITWTVLLNGAAPQSCASTGGPSVTGVSTT